MSIKIIPLDGFRKNYKKLAKKYKNIKEDIRETVLELKENPKAGVKLQHNCYKIRVANSSVPTGKSGGFRIIYYFIDKKENLYLMSIYSKKDQESISESEILRILKLYGLDRF